MTTRGYTGLTNLEVDNLIVTGAFTGGDSASDTSTFINGIRITTAKGIYDAGGDEYVTFTEGSTPVTYINFASGNTGVSPKIRGAGETNTDLTLYGTGTGNVIIGDGADVTKALSFELSGATTAKKMTITSSHTDNRTVTLPDATCTLMGIGASQTFSSDSTSGSTSVESVKVETTMTGAGGVGGRAKFGLTTNVALGGWANAIKGETTFGATGSVTGLGSAVLAEMTLSAGTTTGTYAPIEAELNLGTGAKTGTSTSMLYLSVNGAAASEFDTSGYIMTIAGLTPNTDKVFQASAVTGVNSTHALRIKIGDTAYFIPLHTSKTFAG